MLWFRRRRSQQAVAMVALLATMLLALLPTAARALSAINGDGLMIQTLCTTEGVTRLVVDPSAESDEHPSATHLEECGYCTLLSQLPALPAQQTRTLTPAPLSLATASLAYQPPHLVAFAWPNAQPRAPPR